MWLIKTGLPFRDMASPPPPFFVARPGRGAQPRGKDVDKGGGGGQSGQHQLPGGHDRGTASSAGELYRLDPARPEPCQDPGWPSLYILI